MELTFTGNWIARPIWRALLIMARKNVENSANQGK